MIELTKSQKKTARKLINLGLQRDIGGKTKCVKMNETLNQWKAL